MISPSSLRREPGFGLVELLSVIAVVGMVAGALLGSMAKPRPLNPAQSALDTALGLDALARQAAPRLGALALELGPGTIALVERDSKRVLAARTLPPAISLSLSTPASSPMLEGVVYGRSGTTRSYCLRVAPLEDAVQEERCTLVNGSTGITREH